MESPVRVLIVDDSALIRQLLRKLLAGDAQIQIVGDATNGREALEKVAALRPDLVMLDVRMPVMDGVETTRQIMAYYPTPILVLTASLSSHDVDITFEMLGAGALDVMEKPQLNDKAALDQIQRVLIRKIKLLARVKVVTHLRGRRNRPHDLPAGEHDPGNERGGREPGERQSAPVALQPQRSMPFPVVVIGASTGGPRVVRQILAGMPKSCRSAILVVQHIAQGFSAGMVEWLAETSILPVTLATVGLAILPGQVIVAPDDTDLSISHYGRVQLSAQQHVSPHPAIDITMRSAAELCGPESIGVLLTGMGRDGAFGMQAIQQAGGYTIAQDEASCTIYGMPRAAVELGAARAVLPPDKIIEALVQRVSVQG